MDEKAMERRQGVEKAPVSPAAARGTLFSSRNLWFSLGGVVVLIALGFLVFSSMQGSTVYYLTVGELQAKGASIQGQDVRVAGKALDGSIKWDATSRTAKFEMVDEEGATIPVVYQGLMPDAFRDGSDVVVEGKYTPGGVFQAHTLLAKCPSKYVPAE